MTNSPNKLLTTTFYTVSSLNDFTTNVSLQFIESLGYCVTATHNASNTSITQDYGFMHQGYRLAVNAFEKASGYDFKDVRRGLVVNLENE